MLTQKISPALLMRDLFLIQKIKSTIDQIIDYRRRSDISVFSQLNSNGERPKCPKLAVAL